MTRCVVRFNAVYLSVVMSGMALFGFVVYSMLWWYVVRFIIVSYGLLCFRVVQFNVLDGIEV